MSASTGNIRAIMQPRRPADPGRIEKAQDPARALRGLFRYLKPFKTGMIMVIVLVVIYTLMGLMGPFLMGRAIDRFISTKQAGGLALFALLMLAVYFGSNLFQVIANWVMAGISQRALKLMRKDLFIHVQTLPIRFFDRNPAGELMSRLTNDIDAVNQAVSQNVTSLIASVLSMLGILVAMFVLNVWLAMATLVVIPVMFWFTQFVARYTRKGFRELQMHLGELNAVEEETISGQKVIKAFRRNENVTAVFQKKNQEVFKAGVYANSYALLLMPLTTVLGNFFVIVLAGLGGWLALRNLVSVGLIATFITYGQNFTSPLRQIANLYNSIQAALAGAERVFEIIDHPSEVDTAVETEKPAVIRGGVKFEQVQFGYQYDRPVIKNMSFEARPGQIVALVGPTGAGKTTLVNLLMRFYEVDAGRIAIDGRNINEYRKDDLRRQLGMVLQDTFLFSDTVMENIRFGRLEATDEEVIAAARVADADHYIRQLPQGYETVLSERAGNLSQGQRQLLAIARAVLANPRILILDEATSSVDTRTEARIQKALLRLMHGRTSFVIAHRLSTIRDADKVLVIRDGELVEQGTHHELLDQKGFYYRLYVSQFKGQQI